MSPAGDQKGSAIAAIPAPGTRTPEQLRTDIVSGRQQLGDNVSELRGRINELTDWRLQAEKHQTELIIGAAAVGTVLAGALALKLRSGRGDDF